MKKWSQILFVMIASFLFFFFVLQSKKEKEYQMNLFYFDTYIQIKFSTEKDGESIKKELDSLYLTYHQLSNRYEEYDKNVYYLIHNDSKEKYITVDPKLYALLEYSNSWISKSNGKLNVNLGCVIDIWKGYRESGVGIPNAKEFDACPNVALALESDYRVLNNHANIDLGAIAKGYATKLAGELLESHHVTHYLINAGGNVLAGTPRNKDFYQIGIQHPDKGEVFAILNIKNRAVVTSGGYERYYEYDGVRYHHIIDPVTNYPGNYVKSVTVITEDSALADALSTTLFLMTPEEGQAFLKEYPGVEAIWFTLDGKIIKTEGIANYESK